MKTPIIHGAAPWTTDDMRRLYDEAWKIARRLALREADALAAACFAVDGDDGAALAWAVVDMITDGGVPLAAMPLTEVAGLLARAPTDHAARLHAAFATMIEAVGADLDAEDADDDGDAWGIAA